MQLEQNLFDWEAHLLNTWVIHDDNIKRVTSMCRDEDDEIDPDINYVKDELILALQDADGYIHRGVSGSDITLGFPDLGMSDTGSGVAYIHYIGRRQFRKSMCNNVLEFYILNGMYNRELMLTKRMLSTDFDATYAINNAYQQDYLSFDQAVAKCLYGELSGAALSQEFALGWLMGRSEMSIFYRTAEVGACSDDGTVKLFSNELLESFEEQVKEAEIYVSF